jgi:hypothetical protein
MAIQREADKGVRKGFFMVFSLKICGCFLQATDHFHAVFGFFGRFGCNGLGWGPTHQLFDRGRR